MKRVSVVWGLILILAGVGFLAYQMFPNLFAGFAWPWLLVALGAIFVVVSLLTRTGGTIVPGVILLGVGGILLYQTRTGNWESWAYLWPLMPGLAGLGLFLGSFIDQEMRPARLVGLIMLAAGLVLLAVFGGLFGLTPEILRFWPVLLILVGAIIFFRALRPRSE